MSIVRFQLRQVINQATLARSILSQAELLTEITMKTGNKQLYREAVTVANIARETHARLVHAADMLAGQAVNEES